MEHAFTIWRSKLRFTLDLRQTTSASNSKQNAYNTSMENSKFNVWEASRLFFSRLLRAQNIVQVIEGKII